MGGINPYAYLQQVSLNLDQLRDREQIETVLDELEYLFEVVPPELQDGFESVIGQLRRRLEHGGD